MTESEYLQCIEAAFVWVEEQVERWTRQHQQDLECNRQGSSVLETEFEDGQKLITNAQAPTQQLWLASRHGAHHFVLVPLQETSSERPLVCWEDTRGFGRFEAIFLDHSCRLSGLSLDLSRPLTAEA